MSLLSYLFSWLPNPVTVAQGVASTAYNTAESYACSAAVERATTTCELEKKKSEWWAKYGIWIGAGTVLGALVIYDVANRSGGVNRNPRPRRSRRSPSRRQDSFEKKWYWLGKQHRKAGTRSRSDSFLSAYYGNLPFIDRQIDQQQMSRYDVERSARLTFNRGWASEPAPTKKKSPRRRRR